MKLFFLSFLGILLCANAVTINAQTFKWGQALGTASTAACVAADHEHNMILAGNFKYALHVGADSLLSVAGTNGYIAKYDSSGNGVWVKSISGAGNITVTAVAVGADNNIYTCGRYTGSGFCTAF